MCVSPATSEKVSPERSPPWTRSRNIGLAQPRQYHPPEHVAEAAAEEEEADDRDDDRLLAHGLLRAGGGLGRWFARLRRVAGGRSGGGRVLRHRARHGRGSVARV